MREHLFRFCAGASSEGGYYFSNYECNGLYYYDSVLKVPTFISLFEEEALLTSMLHKQCLRYDSTLIFLPESAKNICFFNLKDKSLEYIELPRYQYKTAIISDALILNHELIIFPRTFEDPIYIVDLDSREITEKWELSNWGKNNIKTENPINLCRLACIGEYLVLPIYRTNKYFIIQKNSLNFEVKESKDCVMFGACQGKDCAWIILEDTRDIICIDSNLESKRVNIEGEVNGRAYNHIIECDNRLVLVPSFKGDIVLVDVLSSECKVIETQTMQVDRNAPMYYGYEIDDGVVTLFPFNNKSILEIRVCEGKITEMNMPIDSSFGNMPAIINSLYSGIVHENDILQLEDLILSIAGD